MEIIPIKYYKRLTKETNVSHYLLFVDAYSKITKLYEVENITTEKFMEHIDIFQARFGKLDEFG